MRSNIKQFTRGLNRVQKRQIPFATAGALTDTAFQVRKRIVERTFLRAFKVRNRRFPGAAFRVAKATKTKLVASVFDRLGRASLALHAKGGVKRARGGHLAVPSRNIRRTASGKIGKAKRPSQLLSGGKAFKGRLRKSTPAIFQRVGGKGRRLKLMFTLVPQVRIPADFKFYQDAGKTATRAFPNNFRKRLRRALATARR